MTYEKSECKVQILGNLRKASLIVTEKEKVGVKRLYSSADAYTAC